MPVAGAGGTSDPPGGGGEGGEAAPDPLENARAEYLGWTKRTEVPVNISTEIFTLCRGPTAAEQAFVESEHGDDLYLLDWLNVEAASGFEAAAAKPFPAGAAIVKEKLVRTGDDYELVALGIMVKRDAGFDPPRGDWEFGYWNADSGMGSGAEENAYCGGCHAGSATDFVFLDGSWRTP
jgi:hypothetical protein